MATMPGSLEDLLAAAGSALSARDLQEREQAGWQSPCKEDCQAACATQSAAGSGSGATPTLLAQLSERQVAAAITLLTHLIAIASVWRAVPDTTPMRRRGGAMNELKVTA